MTYRRKPFLTFACALTGLLLLGAGATLSRHSAHAQSPVMRVDPATQTVDVTGANFTVNILIDNVTNLGSYEFEIQFDPAVLRLVGVENADFLGSSGRQLHCPGGTLDPPAVSGQPATMRYGCATQNRTPPGPSGSGTLAVVTFAPAGPGSTPLTLIASTKITGITDVMSEPIGVSAQSGEVTVVGQGPAHTPDPNEPTPLPTPNSIPAAATATPAPSVNLLLTPDPGEAPLSRPMPGRQMTRPSADSLAADGLAAASANSNSAASSGSSQGSPRAGTGPERETSRWPTVTGLLLMGGGVLLLSFAAYTRRDRRHSSG